MRFELVPTLEIIRDLYEQPRNLQRFRTYLGTIKGSSKDDVELPPLVLLNPMAKDRAKAKLQQLEACDAEAVARAALAEAEARLRRVQGEPLKVGLSIGDDVQGLWTHRELGEATMRLEGDAGLKRGWVTVEFWTGEAIPTPQVIRQRTLGNAYRAVHARRFGWPGTLRDALLQEGRAMRFAGEALTLDEAALARTRKTIDAHLEARDFATIFAALYGDESTRAVGHAALGGIPARGGYALALAEALREKGAPEDALAV